MSLSATQHGTLEFSLSCERWVDYPTNLVCPSEFEHELAAYRAILNNPKMKLFHSNPRIPLQIWSLETASQDHTLAPLQTQADIQQIMTSATSLPVERYIFVQSASSRAALACEKEQMLFILSHNQVMPSFLDILFPFRAREDPHTRTKFSYETSLGKTQPRLTVPSLHFSGFRIEHGFNLIGVEKDEKREDPWLVRQTAAYHSFDVVYRRSTWIILKGNKLIRERLQSSTDGYRKRQPEYAQTVQGCFLANLRSHALIFQWSAENWESYIDHLQEMLSRPRNIAAYTPVLELSKDESLEMTLRKKEVWAALFSRDGSGPDLMSPQNSTSRSGRVFGMFRSRSGLDRHLNRPTAMSTNPTSTKEHIHDLVLDEIFSFDQLQSLHRLGGRLQQAINILGQNKKVLQELKQYFRDLTGSKDFLSFVNLQECLENVAGFFRRIDKIARDMDDHQARLEAMLHDLDRNTALFNEILQYRNMRLGEFGQELAMQAKVSTDSMYAMTIKSRREAISMHIITVWTLVFLPGTFVATFFSSGILSFDEALKFGEWSTSWVGLELFFLVACPIMLITLACWAYFYYRARGKLSQDYAGSSNVNKTLEAGIGAYHMV